MLIFNKNCRHKNLNTFEILIIIKYNIYYNLYRKMIDFWSYEFESFLWAQVISSISKIFNTYNLDTISESKKQWNKYQGEKVM